MSLARVMLMPFSLRVPRASGVPPVRWLALGLVALLAGPSLCSASETTTSASPIPLFSLDNKPAPKASNVGDAACISCHQKKTGHYHQTAHFNTSGSPSRDSIRGKFDAGSNILRTANSNLLFAMEVTDRGYFQKAVLRTSPTEGIERAERFDVVIGSGRKGQTYLYWDEARLFQLPISYWTELGEWINSPGYTDGEANFERPIAARCLECHASTFESHAPLGNTYNKASLVLGISCEKCHGPGGEHVARYQSKSPPVSPLASAIINPARLSRERQIEVCALCHAGIGQPLAPPLSFVPGNVLGDYLTFPKDEPNTPLDVHGSQVQMLERSRCFKSSSTMTCTTCHDVHTPQRDLAAYAVQCLACHKVESCRTFPKLGHEIDRRCIECHMPAQETAQIIISAMNGRTLRPKVRNHQIGIYPGSSRP